MFHPLKAWEKPVFPTPLQPYRKEFYTFLYGDKGGKKSEESGVCQFTKS
jgi:hypothetical protein